MLNLARKLRLAPAYTVAVVAATLAVAAVAFADTIVGDADTSITAAQSNVTVSPGSSGTGSFYLSVDDNGTDPISGCNAGGNNPPVVLNVSSDAAWLTLGSGTVTLNGCGSGQAGSVGFTVAGSAPSGATGTITATYASGGKPGASYTPGTFSVSTPEQADTTAPVIGSSVSGTLGDAGWYVSDVGVTWSVEDAESAVTENGCDPATIDADTAGTTITCSGESEGGSSSDSVTIKRDATAPSAPTATTDPATPQDGDGGWFRDTVTVSYGASTDATSGVTGYSAPQTFSTSGEHAYSGTARDEAGNVSAPAAGTVKVDADAPAVNIEGCPAEPVEQGSAQSVAVTASDAHSGLADDPSGTVPLDTSTLGPAEHTVSATDRVGHDADATCGYEVVAASSPEVPGETPNEGGTPNDVETPNETRTPNTHQDPQTPRDPAPVTPSDDLAPVISNLRAERKCMRDARLGSGRRGRPDVAFHYNLSEDATVTLSIQRRNSTRPPRRRCPGQRRRSKGEGTPDTYTEVGTHVAPGSTGENRNSVGTHAAGVRRFVARADAGPNSVSLSALAASRRLAPGLYRLVAVAQDAAGNRSQLVSVKFWVLAR